jgi:hypothetical protein
MDEQQFQDDCKAHGLSALKEDDFNSDHPNIGTLVSLVLAVMHYYEKLVAAGSPPQQAKSQMQDQLNSLVLAWACTEYLHETLKMGNQKWERVQGIAKDIQKQVQNIVGTMYADDANEH